MFTLYQAEQLLQDVVVEGIEPICEPVTVDSLAVICRAGRRLVLAPCHPRRYVPEGVDQTPKKPKELELRVDALLESFFSRDDAWSHSSDRAVLGAALAVARSADMQPRFSRKLSDAVNVGLLARKGIRAGSYDLPAFDSSRLNAFADENRGGLVDPVEQAMREMTRSRGADVLQAEFDSDHPLSEQVA
jgi:hypothetical protein